MIETIKGDPIQGIISLYEIPEEFATNDDLFRAWWLPEMEWVEGIGNVIVREARISDEAKAQRLVKEPVKNLMTNAGITLYLTNQSVTTQGAMFPWYQITAFGNGTFTGATRALTSLPGDGFASGSRKAPASYVQYGFTSTVLTSFASGDANGTITCCSVWGYKTSGSQNATTTANTGQMQTIAAFPFVKTSANSYVLSYSFILTN